MWREWTAPGKTSHTGRGVFMRGRKWPNKLILKLRPGCHKGPEPCDLLAQADRQEMSGRLQEGDAKGEAMTLSSRDVHQPPLPPPPATFGVTCSNQVHFGRGGGNHFFDEMKLLTRPYRRFVSGNAALINPSSSLHTSLDTKTHKHTHIWSGS